MVYEMKLLQTWIDEALEEWWEDRVKRKEKEYEDGHRADKPSSASELRDLLVQEKKREGKNGN